MRKEQNDIKKFMNNAGQECHDKPVVPDHKTRALRVRLLLEEVLELAEASGVFVLQKLNEEQLKEIDNRSKDDTVHVCITPKQQDFFAISDYDDKVDLVEVADALADIEYVNLGAGVAYGLDVQEFFDEVHESNMSKFIDGHRDAGGKWIKGPSYKEPDLGAVLKKQQGKCS